MAPGRGGQSAMLLVALMAGVTIAELVTSEEQLPRLKFRHSSTNQHSAEWIAGPNGYLYQFHIGEQSWLAAREFCLAENADLVSIKSQEQLDWILRHYAPTHPSFEERFVQIGLVSVGESPDFTWVDGSAVDQSIIQWTTVPEAAGETRCAQLRVNEKKVEIVSCDAAGAINHINRFVCERSTSVHAEQQRSNNYIWRKLENLLTYFGLSGDGKNAKRVKKDEEDDYWQAVETLSESEKKLLVETAKNATQEADAAAAAAAKTEEIEGSGQEDKISEANSASREEKIVDENLKKDEDVEGSEKKEQEVEETLPVQKETAEEVKGGEEASLPEGKKEEVDELNKPTPLRELLDIEEGSGSTLTENANIEKTAESDSDLLASPTPITESDIDKMIDRMQNLLQKLEGKKENTTDGLIPIGPITIEGVPSTAAPELTPIGPIVIEKATSSPLIVDSAAETSTEKKVEEAPLTDEEDSDLLVHLERTTLASTENKIAPEEEHKERLEGDFIEGNEVDEKEMEKLDGDVPRPKNGVELEGELDCDENETEASFSSSSSSSRQLSLDQQQQLAEFLGLLSVFLKHARHDDLRSIIDDRSNLSLIERMRKAISIAKEREAEKQLLKTTMTDSEAEEMERKEKAALMTESERKEVYEEIKQAIKEGIMNDSLSTPAAAAAAEATTPAAAAAEEELLSTTEQPAETTVIVEKESNTVASTTTESPAESTTREGRVRIRIRTLAEVMEEERIEKERAEKEAERLRLAGEKISGAVDELVKQEASVSQIIPLPLHPVEDLEEIDQNEISVVRPSRLRFAGVKTFVTNEDKKMIPVKDVDSISVLQSRELARKKKSDELRLKLEESLARRAAMREAVRQRNEQLKRRIEEETFLFSGRRVRRSAGNDERLKRKDEIRRKILEKEEMEIERLKTRLAQVEKEKAAFDAESGTTTTTTTEVPVEEEEEEEEEVEETTEEAEIETTTEEATRKTEKMPKKKPTTTSSPTTTRPLSIFEQKMDTNHLLSIISKMERQRPTEFERAGPSAVSGIFSNLGQNIHELIMG